MKSIARVSTILAFVLCLGLMTSVQAQEKKDNGKKLSPGLVKLTAKTTPLQKGDKIAFYGDSITMQGGFIDLIAAAVKESPNTKELGVDLIRHGLNGGRVPTVLEGKTPWGDLGGTMESLLEKDKANIVIIFLGVNDVDHAPNGTSKADFEAGLKKMIDMSKKNGATSIVLCTPAVLGEEVNSAKNKTLGEYSDITRKVARDNKLTLVDLHKAFIETLKKVNKDNKHAGNLTGDGIHMNEAGNAIIADQMSLGLVDALKTRKPAPKN